MGQFEGSMPQDKRRYVKYQVGGLTTAEIASWTKMATPTQDGKHSMPLLRLAATLLITQKYKLGGGIRIIY